MARSPVQTVEQFVYIYRHHATFFSVQPQQLIKILDGKELEHNFMSKC